MPAEQRAKISAALQGRIFSPETREKIRASKLGKPRNYVQIHSEEARKRLSNSHKTSERAIEALKLVQESNKGRPASAEARAKISKSLTGRKQSEETIRLRSISLKKAWERRKANNE